MAEVTSFMDIDITINDPSWRDTGVALDPLIRRAIEATLLHAELPDGLDARNIEISVVLTGDHEIQALNRDYRGKDKPTNVLSFPLFDPGFPVMEEAALGDIVLAIETLRREAQEQEKSFADHFTHLLVHGTLHLLGYDHEIEAEAEKMESVEIQILNGMNIKNPYESGSFMA